MDYLTLVIDVLTVIGGSAVFAATPLARVVAYVPLVNKLLNVVAMNIGEAKNAK